MSTNQIFDDMFFNYHHAERRGHVEEQTGKAVVEIGVHKYICLLCGNQTKSGDGRLGRCNIVIPIGQPEGEILSQIADGSGTGDDSCLCVVQCSGQPEHKISEMGSGRTGICYPDEIPRSGENDPGSERGAFPPVRGIAHCPVERDAEAVDANTLH